MTQMQTPPIPEAKKRVSLSSLIIFLVLAAWFVQLFVLSIGRFLEFNTRSAQWEPNYNLRAIREAQLNYRKAHGVFASGPDCFSLLGWEAEGFTQYTYYCGEDSIGSSGDAIRN